MPNGPLPRTSTSSTSADTPTIQVSSRRVRLPRQGTSRLRRSAGRSTSTQLSQAMKQVGTSVSTSHTRVTGSPVEWLTLTGVPQRASWTITARCQRKIAYEISPSQSMIRLARNLRSMPRSCWPNTTGASSPTPTSA